MNTFTPHERIAIGAYHHCRAVALDRARLADDARREGRMDADVLREQAHAAFQAVHELCAIVPDDYFNAMDEQRLHAAQGARSE